MSYQFSLNFLNFRKFQPLPIKENILVLDEYSSFRAWIAIFSELPGYTGTFVRMQAALEIQESHLLKNIFSCCWQCWLYIGGSADPGRRQRKAHARRNHLTLTN